MICPQYVCLEELRYINWREHQPPHFHATYGGDEVIVSIRELEVIEGGIPSKQLKMLLGWAAFHQEELLENWALAENMQETTLVTVAQRVSSVKDCSLILVLEEGDIIGIGTHEQLLESCTEYKEISDSQMGGAFLD